MSISKHIMLLYSRGKKSKKKPPRGSKIHHLIIFPMMLTPPILENANMMMMEKVVLNGKRLLLQVDIKSFLAITNPFFYLSCSPCFSNVYHYCRRVAWVGWGKGSKRVRVKMGLNGSVKVGLIDDNSFSVF